MFTAQEILVGNADYPTEPIAETSRQFRQLGLGYANLGALLMALGMPYDSDVGRAYTSALTAVMTGHAYATSARTAARMGPFAGYADNEEPMLNVLRMHRDAAATQIDESLVPAELAGEARERLGRRGRAGRAVRRAQLAGQRARADGHDRADDGLRHDRHRARPRAHQGEEARRRRHDVHRQPDGAACAAQPRLQRSDEIDRIVAYIDEQKTIVGAPVLKGEHLPVFACSMGDNVDPLHGPHPDDGRGAAVDQRCDLQDREHARRGDGRRRRGALHRVVAARAEGGRALPRQLQGRPAAVDAEEGGRHRGSRGSAAQIERIVETVIVQEPVRQKLPRTRTAKTFSFRVADCHGYVTVGEYDDGRPGEMFLQVAKQGSTLAGIMDAFAISVSHGLQYGVPLEAFVEMFTNMRFEPAGMTDDPDIRFATSLVDYIFRRLAVEYLAPEKREALGILTVGERLQPTLPGVEESTTPTEHVDRPAARRPGAVGTRSTRPQRRRRSHAAGAGTRSASSCSATSAAT